jgi:NAD+ kinase
MARMPPAFKTVALVGRYKTASVAEPIRRLGTYLAGLGCVVRVERDTAAESGVDDFPSVDMDDIGGSADLVVIFGGDGSMLAAARHLAPTGVPLVGVNQGRLGFMTDIALGSMLEQMGRIQDGDFTVEPRTMLHAAVHRATGVVYESSALNDVVLSKGGTGRLIEFLVQIDGQFVYDLRSDGLIIATPTGSTAYALSSNGPILQPSVPGLVLVPISPHTLSNRPIVIAEDAVIEIAVKRAADARLHVDGQPQTELEEGDRIVIQRAPHPAKLVHPPGYSYYAMLREKLHWSENPF